LSPLLFEKVLRQTTIREQPYLATLLCFDLAESCQDVPELDSGGFLTCTEAKLGKNRAWVC
jgi:hypothetical protein